MGVAVGFATQYLAFLGNSLFQSDTNPLGGLCYLAAGDLQQTAVDRMGDGFFLDGRIDNNPLEFLWCYRLALNCSVDCRFQQRFNASFTNCSTKAASLRGITG